MKVTKIDKDTSSENAEVGEKCSSLVQLIHLGINVPEGIVVATSAYGDHAIQCGLYEKIYPLIKEQDWARAEETAFDIIQQCPLDEEFSGTLLNLYSQMKSPVVAVRSSATSEDLEGVSSAGQYETFLNVRGAEALLLAGEVLVCPYTNPAWTPLFTTAIAVVTETGGLASHTAIVAREYGVPAVMSVPGVTRTLKEGQEIQVDGSRGIVYQ